MFVSVKQFIGTYTSVGTEALTFAENKLRQRLYLMELLTSVLIVLIFAECLYCL